MAALPDHQGDIAMVETRVSQPIKLNVTVARELLDLIQEALAFLDFPRTADTLVEERAAKKAALGSSLGQRLSNADRKGDLVSGVLHGARPCEGQRIAGVHAAPSGSRHIRRELLCVCRKHRAHAQSTKTGPAHQLLHARPEHTHTHTHTDALL